jgi:polar amino acid transport system permease protein
VARPRTYGPRSLAALGLVVLVVLLSWTGLLAFKHSLSLSSFELSGKPKATFDVFHCGASTRYRSGRFNDKTGVARVTIPFGCWEVRPEEGDTSGLQPQTFRVASGTRDSIAGGVLGLAGAAALGLLVPAIQAVRHSRRAARLAIGEDLIDARIEGDTARQWSSYAFGFSAAVAVIALLLLFLSLARGEVRTPFFNFTIVGRYFGEMVRAFVRNIKIFLVAEVFVLVWGLVVAIGRLTPGRAGAPVRWLAVGYIDMFRGLPAVIVLFLIDFGLKKSGIPGLSKLDDFWYAVMALTLTYGAYVAEVYRAGIDSIHWSQTAAARSLGLSHTKTLRYVVIPQAVRRIVPPLLNDFIGLQKDTSLVGFIGVVEVVNQARIINSTEFNLSAMTVAAAFFYIITVPQARLVDVLLRRDQARMRAGG